MNPLNLILILVLLSVVGVVYMQSKVQVRREAYADKCVELIHPSKLVVIQGSSSNFSLKPSVFDEDPSKPSVDGTLNGPKSMFAFAFNKVSPECCGTDNSIGYSTSGGCVCISPEQKKYFSQSVEASKSRC